MMNKLFFPLVYLFFFTAILARAQAPDAIIDVEHYAFRLQLNDENNVIKGRAEVELKFLKDAGSFKLDLVSQNETGKGMLVSSVTEDGATLQFRQNNDELSISGPAKAGSEHTYSVTYSGVPVDGLIISTNQYKHRTFFGDNWPNRAHNWLPCVDDPADKATVDFIITAPDHYDVVANGAMLSEAVAPGKLKITHWKESAPLSTKVMVIGVADFAIDHTGDVGNVPVYSYVFPENKEAGFKAYSEAKKILAYYMNKIGPYPFEKLANVQSKTIFGGLENASAIFYFERSVDSNDIEELMAHEIAHQWFGDAATETSFSHLWLSEGFATFMTSVYLEHKYGADTLKRRLKSDRELVLNLEKTRNTPVVDTTVKSNFMELLNANSYQKGGWVLHMLRRRLGEEAYWKGIRNYYAKYDGGNASTGDLCTVLEQASGQDLKSFFKQWLYTPGTPHLRVTLIKNNRKDAVEVTITQQQDDLFIFPLEVSAGGVLHTIAIKDKVTHVQFALKDKSAPFVIDPNVNILAEFVQTEQIQ